MDCPIWPLIKFLTFNSFKIDQLILKLHLQTLKFIVLTPLSIIFNFYYLFKNLVMTAGIDPELAAWCFPGTVASYTTEGGVVMCDCSYHNCLGGSVSGSYNARVHWRICTFSLFSFSDQSQGLLSATVPHEIHAVTWNVKELNWFAPGTLWISLNKACIFIVIN